MQALVLKSPCQGTANEGSLHTKEEKKKWTCFPFSTTYIIESTVFSDNTVKPVSLISLCFLCCWPPQVTESISYPYYTSKAQLTHITRTMWRKASTVPPCPVWHEGADHVSPWRNPIPCTATLDDRAAPLHWWQNSLPSCHPLVLPICGFSQLFSGRWFLMTGAALRENGQFISFEELQTQPPFSAGTVCCDGSQESSHC